MSQDLAAGRGALEEALQGLIVRASRQGLAPGALAVQQLCPDHPFYAACDSAGDWALAIVTTPGSTPQSPVRLESFAAEFGVDYLLDEQGTKERMRVCVLRCLSARRDIRDLFLVVCDAVMRQVTGCVTDVAISAAVNSWLGLFHKLQLPSRSTVVGLIGELTFLNSCDDAGAAVRAWHSDVTNTIDFVFSDPAVEVEVKATTGSRRVHSVSLQQVIYPPGIRRFFASVLVDLRSSGVEVAELVETITKRVKSDEELLLLWRGLADTCGDQLENFLAQRFLLDAATTSIALFSSEVVPQPELKSPVHTGVSDVRFRSDFTASRPTSMESAFAVPGNPS